MKLEPGKKYIIKDGGYNPYTFVVNLKDFGCHSDHLLFVDRAGDQSSWCEDILGTITEHKEPIKKSGEFWVCLSSGQSPNEMCTADKLTGVDTDGAIYFSEEDALAGKEVYEKIARFKYTVEQVIEGEAKNV